MTTKFSDVSAFKFRENNVPGTRIVLNMPITARIREFGPQTTVRDDEGNFLIVFETATAYNKWFDGLKRMPE